MLKRAVPGLSPFARISFEDDQARHVAKLILTLAEGEDLAATVAHEQSRFLVKSHPRLAKFLKRQSAQEKFHQRIFAVGARWVSAKGAKNFAPGAFAQLKQQLLGEVQRGHIVNSIIGLQVGIEALGDAFLDTLDSRMERRNMGLALLRKTIRAQESAHQDFGRRVLANAAIYSPQDLDLDAVNLFSQGVVERIEGVLRNIEFELNEEGLTVEHYMADVTQQVSGAIQTLKSAQQRESLSKIQNAI